MTCGFRCHEIGGPFIAENPECPIHGADGIGDKIERMQSIMSELIEILKTKNLTTAEMQTLVRAEAMV